MCPPLTSSWRKMIVSPSPGDALYKSLPPFLVFFRDDLSFGASLLGTLLGSTHPPAHCLGKCDAVHHHLRAQENAYFFVPRISFYLYLSRRIPFLLRLLCREQHPGTESRESRIRPMLATKLPQLPSPHGSHCKKTLANSPARADAKFLSRDLFAPSLFFSVGGRQADDRPTKSPFSRRRPLKRGPKRRPFSSPVFFFLAVELRRQVSSRVSLAKVWIIEDKNRRF